MRFRGAHCRRTAHRMKFRSVFAAVLPVMALMVPAHCGAGASANEPIQPIPLSLKQDRGRAHLGARLFSDPGLSGDGRVSCASCHNLSLAGADGRQHSPGLNGKLTMVNTPTVLNAALNFRQFWDGRADSLEMQVDQVIRNPDEMGGNWKNVLRRLSADPSYQTAFSASYKDGVTQANVQNAIATFERTLITPNSRFDRYLRGEQDAINTAEKTGYAKFKQYGCIACHQGVNVGGNMFQKFGVMGNYFEGKAQLSRADLGRFSVTGRDGDRHVFKVPSLRNVARTAPYFHDGSVATLREAVDIMFRFQLGRVASAADKDSIILFLNTLTGEPLPDQ
jgi:cytochrome c peroxidase